MIKHLLEDVSQDDNLVVAWKGRKGHYVCIGDLRNHCNNVFIDKGLFKNKLIIL